MRWVSFANVSFYAMNGVAPLWKNSNELQLFCGKKHWNKSSYCKMHYDKTHDKTKTQMKERRV